MTSMASELLIIDSDSHVTEPADLWTSRVSTQRWGDLVPHVRLVDDSRGTALETLKSRDLPQFEAWFVGDQMIGPATASAMAGWPEPFPSHPPTYEQAMPASYDPKERLRVMDESGIWAQALYGNIGGFGSERFRNMADQELALACVRAYNDFLIDFASTDPNRLLPIAAIPYWNVDEAIKEIQRAKQTGHKGMIFSGAPQDWGQPWLPDRHWDPIWAAAQECDLPVSFHGGSGNFTGYFQPDRVAIEGTSAAHIRSTAMILLDSAHHLADLLMSGILPRFPALRFVLVESGIGWIPFLLELLDYMFQLERSAMRTQRPDFELLPSEYFHRQVYVCHLFEKSSSEVLESIGIDQIMFETDFPHPGSKFGVDVVRNAEAILGALPEDARRKMMFENAAKLYRVPAPPSPV